MNQLMNRWRELKDNHPRGVRIRDAARMLETGEAQLLAASISGDGEAQEVVRLRPEFKALFELFEGTGEMMCSTRNEYAVIEKHGTYREVEIGDYIGLAVDREIDLRLFMSHFHSVFYVAKPHRGKILKSIQFFDKTGLSLHKVYAQDELAEQLLDTIREQFAHDDQSAQEERHAPSEPREYAADEDVDVETFQQEWRDLKDTHEFFGLLMRHKLERLQAFRLAPEGYTKQVTDFEVVDRLLRESAKSELPIMVFVGSPGCIEIHTGTVKKIVETGTWINVMDPRFNLHLNRAGIADVWFVRKPTADGIVTSIECFDEEGKNIAMFFGERKPGIPELEAWRRLAEELCEVTPAFV